MVKPELLSGGSHAAPSRRRTLLLGLLAVVVLLATGAAVVLGGSGREAPRPVREGGGAAREGSGDAGVAGAGGVSSRPAVLAWQAGTVLRVGPGVRRSYRLPAADPPVLDPVSGSLVGRAQGVARVVPADDPGAEPRRLGPAARVLAVRDGGAWLVRRRGGVVRVVSRRLTDGVRTGATRVPRRARPAGLVATARGEAVVVTTRGPDPRTGVLGSRGPRRVARVVRWVPGRFLAADGTRVVTLACGPRRCRLGITDVGTAGAIGVRVEAPAGTEFLRTPAAVVPGGVLAFVADRRGRSPWSALVRVRWPHPRVPPEVAYVDGTGNVAPDAGLGPGADALVVAVPGDGGLVPATLPRVSADAGVTSRETALARGSRLVGVVPLAPGPAGAAGP